MYETIEFYVVEEENGRNCTSGLSSLEECKIVAKEDNLKNPVFYKVVQENRPIRVRQTKIKIEV